VGYRFSLRSWQKKQAKDQVIEVEKKETTKTPLFKLPRQFLKLYGKSYFYFTLGNSSDAFIILRLNSLELPIFGFRRFGWYTRPQDVVGDLGRRAF